MKTVIKNLLWACFLVWIFSAFSCERIARSAVLVDSSIEERIDKVFSAWDKPDSPGAAIAIIRNGEVLIKKGYGCASVEHDIPITTKTVFNIASLSKQFTAMAIAVLAAKGDLSLDDDIRKHIPEIPEFGGKISVGHLIHHTSGLREFGYVGMKMAGWDNEDMITHKQILKMLTKQKESNFAPGEEYSYCNTGYCLLAEIVSRVSGEPFLEWMQKNIFYPLEMKNTYVKDDIHAVIKKVANPYIQGKRDKLARYNTLKAPVGAGCIYSTIEDMTKWAQNFENGNVGGPKVFAMMRTRGVLNNGNVINYAFGQHVSLWNGLLKIDHSGAGGGWNSYFARFPDQKYSIIILANCEMGASRIGNKINRILLKENLRPTEKSPALKSKRVKKIHFDVNPELLKKYVGAYEVRPSLYFRVEERNKTLWGGFTKRPKRRMLPVSENEFFWMIPGNDVKLSFTFDENKNVSSLRIFEYSDGSETISKRVDYVAYNIEKLKEFAGNYYSEELQTVYFVEVKNGSLCLQHQKNEDVELLQELDDFFVSDSLEPYWCEKVRFFRDKDKGVVGFLLSGYHVRNVRFTKFEQRTF